MTSRVMLNDLGVNTPSPAMGSAEVVVHESKQDTEQWVRDHIQPKTQGLRDNCAKAPITMVLEATRAIEGIAQVLAFGAKKYGRRNWMKGLKYTEILDSSDRHQLAILRGESLDVESGLPHADHFACNALFLSEMMHTRPDMDDRDGPES